MPLVRTLAVLTMVVGAAALGYAACRSPRRVAQAQGPIKESWVAPPRVPKHCDWYSTADSKYWSDREKVRAEHDCLLEEDLRRFVTARQQCSDDVDCVVVASDCPFGCMGIPVNVSHADAVSRQQAELRKKLDSECMYKCRPVTRTVCENRWCVAAW